MLRALQSVLFILLMRIGRSDTVFKPTTQALTSLTRVHHPSSIPNHLRSRDIAQVMASLSTRCPRASHDACHKNPTALVSDTHTKSESHAGQSLTFKHIMIIRRRYSHPHPWRHDTFPTELVPTNLDRYCTPQHSHPVKLAPMRRGHFFLRLTLHSHAMFARDA